MKQSATQRNDQVHELFESLLLQAKSKKIVKFPLPFTEKEIEILFSSHIWGHREILLTILLARMIDPSFKASEDFYACNPRSLYEKPIRQLLREYSIPHKKSGPLNVAKNSKQIDKVWAFNKRGKGIALTVANLVKKIEQVSPNALQIFALAYVKRYLAEAKKVAQLKVKLEKIEDPIFLSKLSKDLVTHVPDGGAIPQLIVGLIQEYFNKSNESPIKISGHLDSVSATNTTSKKPGDIIETFPNGKIRVYEITVKEFSQDRMIESHESIKAYTQDCNEVFVICREQDLPKSVKRTSNKGFIGISKYQDIIYYFIDIFEWISNQLVFMNNSSRMDFYADLVVHVNHFNSSEKVKKYFSKWHDENFTSKEAF